MEKDIEPVITVDLAAVIKITQKFMPLLKRSCDSRIILMTSFITYSPMPCLAPYVIAKNGVKAFADVLRSEMNSHPKEYNNMKIINIQPTAYKTGITHYDGQLQQVTQTWNRTPEGLKDNYNRQIFTGFYRFISCCRFFQIFDFIAIRKDVFEVARAIEQSITSDEPLQNFPVMPWYHHYLYVKFYSLPDDVLHAFFSLAIPALRYYVEVIAALVFAGVFAAVVLYAYFS
jgi:NAD(P)-dependent dehydrogenase (short-subunit alcohol dehydrogenase family)